jgi:predicted CoA-binding protein
VPGSISISPSVDPASGADPGVWREARINRQCSKMETVSNTGAVGHRAAVADFLAQKAIVVVGVTREKEGPANGIYQKLRSTGHTVIPVNPNTDTFRDAPCYPSVRDVMDPVDGVVIVTRPEVTERVVDDCIARGVPRIWIHNMLGTDVRFGRGVSRSTSSASPDAVMRARAAGITVIAGGCPLQHIPPVDPFHRCIFWVAQKAGNY